MHKFRTSQLCETYTTDKFVPWCSPVIFHCYVPLSRLKILPVIGLESVSFFFCKAFGCNFTFNHSNLRLSGKNLEVRNCFSVAAITEHHRLGNLRQQNAPSQPSEARMSRLQSWSSGPLPCCILKECSLWAFSVSHAAIKFSFLRRTQDRLDWRPV